ARSPVRVTVVAGRVRLRLDIAWLFSLSSRPPEPDGEQYSLAVQPRPSVCVPRQREGSSVSTATGRRTGTTHNRAENPTPTHGEVAERFPGDQPPTVPARWRRRTSRRRSLSRFFR